MLGTPTPTQQMLELHNATVQDAYRGLLGDVTVPVMALDKRQAYWREAIEYAEPQVHVALLGERIVGFVGFDRSRDEGTKQTMGEIWSIYVDADFVGLGVGLSLWDAAREGDLVLTSGDGGVLPRGLAVGRVVRGADGGWRVRLATDAAPIDYVRILRFEDFVKLEDLRALSRPSPPPPPTPVPALPVQKPRPDQAKPTQARPTQAKPTQARPTQARPTQARPDAANPDPANPDLAKPVPPPAAQPAPALEPAA
jgi:hypothetical protein